MRVVGLFVYRGPSLHADGPAIRIDIEFGAARERKAADVGGLIPFLAQALRRDEVALATQWGDILLPELVGKLAQSLHRQVMPTDLWSVVERADPSEPVRIVFRHADPQLGLLAARTAVAWISAFLVPATGQAAPDPKQALGRFGTDFAPFFPGANAKLIIAEAARRGIPWSRVIARNNTVRLGQGNRQRWLRETLIDSQSRMAVDAATDKHMTNGLLAAAGVPVPRQFRAFDLDSAIGAARRLGYPVVVKPAQTDRGTAVHVGIRDDAALQGAYADAARFGAILVEQLIPGFDHRILVLKDRVLAAAKRLPAFVIGDGRQSVRELLAEENRNPRRIDGYVAHLLQRIKVDGDMVDQLAHQGLDLESVPRRGMVVQLHGTANLSTGGVPQDVTARVHPDNRDMFVRATRLLGLEMAGVDFLTLDIGRSYREVGGAICEMNAIPGLRAHIAAKGSPDVISPIVDCLFPEGAGGRIPIATVTGTNGKTTTSRMVAAMLRHSGHCVGLATTDGVRIGETDIARYDLAGVPGVEMILHDPAVTAAVLESARGGLIRNGLGFDACDVAAVLNVTDDHLGFEGIRSREDMARVKATVLKAARRAVVLNADDELCRHMAEVSRAQTLWWFARDAANETVRQHIAAGLPAVTLAGGVNGRRIVVWRDGAPEDLISVADIPCTFGGRADFNVANAQAAAAIGFGLGLERDAVASALSGFVANVAMSSGRCNFIEGWPFKIVVDYAHNPAGVAALCRFLATEPVDGRRWLVLTSFGNRLESHFFEVGAAAAAGAFDAYICTTNGPRIRTVAEVADLLARGLVAAGVQPERIRRAESETAALAQAVAEAAPGDLVVVLSSDAKVILADLARLRRRSSRAAGGDLSSRSE